MQTRPISSIGRFGLRDKREELDTAQHLTDPHYRHRALRTQGILRVFIAAALLVNLYAFSSLPPQSTPEAIALSYGLWSLAVLSFLWLSRIAAALAGWLLIADLVAFATLQATSESFSSPGLLSPVADNFFFLLPLLAAFLLQPAITATAGACSAFMYTVGVMYGQGLSSPYWHSTLLHALLILVMTAGCVLISRIQQARVRIILTLMQHRSRLLAEVMSAEERERNELAESLHDGAIQMVLAARHEIEEGACENASPALARADALLQQVTDQLRSSIKELHSEVLETSGIADALNILAQQAATRGELKVKVECDISTADSANLLLYRAARELLSNVVKHAQASSVIVRLHQADDRQKVALEISDDGIGINLDDMEAKVRAGHIGLASQRICIESAGGDFSVAPSLRGTKALVTLPINPPQQLS